MAKRVESPSSINTFKQCPRKYFYQYIAKLPTSPSIHTVRGNIAHSTLEHIYDIDQTQLTEENFSLKIKEAAQRLLINFWKEYKPKLDQLKLNPDQERFYFEETMMMILNWSNHFIKDLTSEMQNRKCSIQEAYTLLTPIREQEFKSEKLSVRGFVDAIHKHDNEIMILDYKTNANSDIKESIMLQLGIYCVLYQELYNVIPQKVGIFFLRDKAKIMNVDPELLVMAKKEIDFVHSQTSVGEDIILYNRKITPLCKWSSGQCDFYGTCKPHDKIYQPN